MFSIFDFAPEEIEVLQGSLDHLSQRIVADKIRPKGRQWIEGEQQDRAEHLEWIIGLLQKMKEDKDQTYRGFTIGNITVSFDIEENELLAIFAACKLGQFLLKNDPEVIEALGQAKADELSPIVTSLISRLTHIGAAKHALELDWMSNFGDIGSVTEPPKTKLDIPDFTQN
jgi:hypothetical protein